MHRIKLKVLLIFYEVNKTFLWVDLSLFNQSYSGTITTTKIWNWNSKANLTYAPETMSSTDRRTDRRTRWIQYTPPPTSLGGGIKSLSDIGGTTIQGVGPLTAMVPGVHTMSD